MGGPVVDEAACASGDSADGGAFASACQCADGSASGGAAGDDGGRLFSRALFDYVAGTILLCCTGGLLGGRRRRLLNDAWALFELRLLGRRCHRGGWCCRVNRSGIDDGGRGGVELLRGAGSREQPASQKAAAATTKSVIFFIYF